MKFRYAAGLVAVMLAGQPAHAAEIRVSLDNPPADGAVVFVLYDSPNTFGDLRDPVMTVTAELDGRDIYTITNVPAGE